MKKNFLGLTKGNPKALVRLVALMGVLIALCIVFERLFNISIGNTIRFSLVFIPISIASIVLGALPGMIVAALMDIIGALMVGYAVFPLITLCVVLTAFTYGMILYQKRTLPRVIIAVVIDQAFISLIVKSFALAVGYYGLDAFGGTIVTRLPQISIMIPIEIVVIYILGRYLYPQLKRLTGEFIN